MNEQLDSAELCDMTVTELAVRLSSGEVSATEVLDAHLRRIEECNGELNAVVSLDEEGARATARAADQARAAGGPLGPLHGVPMTLKDAIDVAGLRTTIGTWELDNVPTSDATVAARLRAAGANIIGHTNVAAWLADNQTSNPVFGRTNNPWDVSRTAGGSSGGAAAAVASGMTPAEVGSDLVGSVRQPAGLCGVYGLRSTEHRVPLTGFFRVPGGARSVRIMASLGPMARSLDDLELMLSVISGPDGYDADAPPVPFEPRPAVAPGELRLAVAPVVPGAPVASVLSDRVRQVAAAVSDAGGRVEEVLPDVSADEQLQLFGELLQMVTTVFSGGDGGSGFTLGRYLEALDRRDRLIAMWDGFFDRYDALLMPSAATVAYPHTEAGSLLDIDGVQVPYHEQGFVFAMSSLNGLPGLVMPAGLDADGLPTGIQLVGRRWSEATLLAVGQGLEGAGLTPGFQRPA